MEDPKLELTLSCRSRFRRLYRDEFPNYARLCGGYFRSYNRRPGALGFAAPTSYAPESQFGIEALANWQNIVILALGGIMVGFGARYAGGCTSGHAISGISDLQPASLLAVVGFFIGGLAMTHLIFPLIY